MSEESSFDIAATKAEAELAEMAKEFTEEQEKLMIKLSAWVKKWYQSAGLKRLARIIRNFRG